MTHDATMKMRKPVLDVLNRRTPERVPFWLMRQAGRYLPEYRELRAQAGGFLDLVFDPERASEVTVQPLRRFGMDAAILFSDILIVPKALGQDVRFEAGEGPRLTPVTTLDDFAKLDMSRVLERSASVFETVRLTAKKMRDENFNDTALIGFCGSPWTVACYMVEGKGSRDFDKVRRFALESPDVFQKLIDLVTEASCIYLAGQIEAGADAVKLFDSWSGVLDAEEFTRWVTRPTQKIVKFLKTNYPQTPVIGFPRGAGVKSIEYATETGIDCVAVDQAVPPAWAAEHLQTLMPVQGNLDPARLLSGGKALEDGMENIREAFSARPFIFNLGHGVIKETDPLNVAHCAKIIRSWSLV